MMQKLYDRHEVVQMRHRYQSPIVGCHAASHEWDVNLHMTISNDPNRCCEKPKINLYEAIQSNL